MCTFMRVGVVGEGWAVWDMRVRRVQISGGVSERPQHAFM